MAPAHVGRALEVVIDPGVIGPDWLARSGVERGRLSECCDHVHEPTSHQRRRDERAWADPFVLRRHCL